MPRDNDKDNNSRGRRDRPGGGKPRWQGPLRRRAGAGKEVRQARVCRQERGRSARASGALAGKSDGAKSFGKKPYGPENPTPASATAMRRPFHRSVPAVTGRLTVRRVAAMAKADVQAAWRSSEIIAKTVAAKSGPTRRAEIVRIAARRVRHAAGDRPNFNGDDPTRRAGDRGDARPAARFRQEVRRQETLYAARPRWRKATLHAAGRGLSERRRSAAGGSPVRARPPRDGERGDRPERKFDGERKFSRGAPDRARARISATAQGFWRPSAPRRFQAVAEARGVATRIAPARTARSFDKPRFDKPRDDRGGDERPRFSRAREDRPQGDRPDDPRFDRPREDRPKFDRPRRDDGERKFDRPRERPEGRTDWQEHPRSDRGDRFADRPRRENEDDSKVFAKRPAFGGRGAYRERPRDDDRRSSRSEVK